MTGEADVPKNTSRAIVIPLDERTLGEFIASLLGQRRSIERNFNDRRFEIDSNWLLNLDDVILQRINSQHTAKLVSFSARIYFSNGKIVTLQEEKSFRHYNDISSEISVGVDLRWSFLIKFPLAGIPEKQEIRFAAFTDATIIGEVKAKERRSSRSFLSTRGEDERFLYSVQFTNVTWGEDLSATIDAYITGKSEGMP